MSAVYPGVKTNRSQFAGHTFQLGFCHLSLCLPSYLDFQFIPNKFHLQDEGNFKRRSERSCRWGNVPGSRGACICSQLSILLGIIAWKAPRPGSDPRSQIQRCREGRIALALLFPGLSAVCALFRYAKLGETDRSFTHGIKL